MVDISKTGVYAEVVKHSKAANSESELVTLNVRYGLIIHAEFLRHRRISRGVKSNRAIEPHRIRKEVLQDPYIPFKFGQNQRGMRADNNAKYASLLKGLWCTARYPALAFHFVMDKLGLHKEVCNRILNPWQWVRETITLNVSELDNLYNLRLHKDAQLDIQKIVERIKFVVDNSKPQILYPGEWHTPYVTTKRHESGELLYIDNNGANLTATEACEASAARCARSSYNNHDGTTVLYDKKTSGGMTDKELYQQLIATKPVHASPVEHQGTPMQISDVYVGNSINQSLVSLEDGVTHIGVDGSVWSANFKGWIQRRQLIPNNVCHHYIGS